MGLLVTLYLIASNTFNSVKAPQNRGFSYIEIWTVGVQIPILMAIFEYGFVLALLKYKTYEYDEEKKEIHRLMFCDKDDEDAYNSEEEYEFEQDIMEANDWSMDDTIYEIVNGPIIIRNQNDFMKYYPLKLGIDISQQLWNGKLQWIQDPRNYGIQWNVKLVKRIIISRKDSGINIRSRFGRIHNNNPVYTCF